MGKDGQLDNEVPLRNANATRRHKSMLLYTSSPVFVLLRVKVPSLNSTSK